MNPTYTDKGSLQIFVTAGETPDPIPGARVRITDPTDGKVLEEVTAAYSGQTLSNIHIRRSRRLHTCR